MHIRNNDTLNVKKHFIVEIVNIALTIILGSTPRNYQN